MLLLNKLLPAFVLPIGLVIILVVLGTLKKWRWTVFAAMAGLLAASTPRVGTWLIGRLEAVHPRVKIEEVGPADAVLVLGGMLGPSAPEGYHPDFAEGVDRFEAGVALFKAGRAPVLLFTGATLPLKGPPRTEGDFLRNLAIARGVPATAVEVTGKVENTVDEARQVKRYCAERGIKRVILVTSAFHMPRSVRTFRNAGVDVIPFPVDYRYDSARAFAAVDLVPSASHGLMHTEAAMRECYGIAFYTLLGR